MRTKVAIDDVPEVAFLFRVTAFSFEEWVGFRGLTANET